MSVTLVSARDVNKEIKSSGNGSKVTSVPSFVTLSTFHVEDRIVSIVNGLSIKYERGLTGVDKSGGKLLVLQTGILGTGYEGV